MNRRSLIAAILGVPVAGVATVAAAQRPDLLIIGEGDFVVDGTRVIVRQIYDPRTERATNCSTSVGGGSSNA